MKQFLRKLRKGIGILGSIFVGIGISLYLMMPKAPKPPESFNDIDELETYLASVADAKRPPGLSVMVVKDGGVAYANGFGVADATGHTPVTQDTVYHWWSMTKVVTAVAVMQLHERGQLDIDDPVNDYLPYFNVTFNGDPASVTIRQLLNHSAGMSNATPEIFTWVHLEGDPPVSQSELVIDKFADYSELLFASGEKTQYSNWGYTVLGALVEDVAGQTYENYVVENILQPLGMAHTDFVYRDAMAEYEATGSQHLVDIYTPFLPLLNLNYTVRERVGMRLWFHRVYNDQTAPSGLIGSAADIGQFMNAYLQESDILLSPDSFVTMNTIISQLHPADSSLRGLGWEARLTNDERRYLTHSGGGPGFATVMRLYPEEHLGIVVMGNDSTMDREALADVLANFEWQRR